MYFTKKKKNVWYTKIAKEPCRLNYVTKKHFLKNYGKLDITNEYLSLICLLSLFSPCVIVISQLTMMERECINLHASQHQSTLTDFPMFCQWTSFLPCWVFSNWHQWSKFSFFFQYLYTYIKKAKLKLLLLNFVLLTPDILNKMT